MKKLEKKYNIKENEAKWQQYWQDAKIFKFDWNDINNRDNIYSIDTPPPHVSGALHMGHIFSYTQMDIIARFQRMIGKNVFYPIGFDDNGLPSERYVEKKINKKSKSMDRQEFVAICDKEIQDAEKFMKEVGQLSTVHEQLIQLEKEVKESVTQQSTTRGGVSMGYDPGDF